MLLAFYIFSLRPPNPSMFCVITSCESTIPLSVGLFSGPDPFYATFVAYLPLLFSIGFSGLLLHCRSTSIVPYPPSFFRRRLSWTMIFCTMLYSLDVPSSFDNPSSLDTYLVSSSDAVSTSDVPSLRSLLRRLDKF